ncbi:hypothetical protein AVEN_89114-1 [Araneus ventricosus]|uniref:Uncharacterized protein n=1 Tax=Araneus ventricosus TaxID=182803 RepID=A0A4Y2B2K3_ARAVE|nr:hypothetical protein AVEN_89114-1 [Araneus ventricosus]
MEQWEIVPREQYSVVFEELSKERPAKDESDATDFAGEVTEYNDQETTFETDLEVNPVHEENSDSNVDAKEYNICPFNL